MLHGHRPAVEQRRGGKRGDQGGIIEGVPVGWATGIGHRLLRIGVLHHRIPALQSRGRRNVERNGVTIGCGKWRDVPLGYA